MSFGAHFRGDTFRRTFALQNGWESTDFDELWFTVRASVPGSNVTDDANVLAQVKMTSAGITFQSATGGTVLISPTLTRTWPVGTVRADLQGRSLAGDIYTITSGTIAVRGDLTRSS